MTDLLSYSARLASKLIPVSYGAAVGTLRRVIDAVQLLFPCRKKTSLIRDSGETIKGAHLDSLA